MKKTTGKSGGAPAKDVTAYIAAAPAASRAMLRQLRALIRAEAPNAEEVISYRMPMYKYHGMLLGFAAFEHHVGFYAISAAIQKAHAAELKGYKTGKGSVQFPLGTRLPVTLIKRMVAERVAEKERKADAQAKAKRKG